MNNISNDQLVGVVLRFINIAALLPRYAGRVGLDIRIEHGRLQVGQNIQLLGPKTITGMKVLGIELKHDPMEPKVIRIHCDSPAGVSFPDGHAEGWTIIGK